MFSEVAHEVEEKEEDSGKMERRRRLRAKIEALGYNDGCLVLVCSHEKDKVEGNIRRQSIKCRCWLRQQWFDGRFR